MSCEHCLCRTCIFSCELSYSRDSDEFDAIDEVCFTCDECRWWHGADSLYRIQTRQECEQYRASRQAIERQAEATRKKFTIINGGKDDA